MKVLRVLGLMAALPTALTLTSCKKDPCKNVTCQNGGTCTDGNCQCALPWEGARCDVDGRDKFVGAWRGTRNCDGSVESGNLSIFKSSTRPRFIIIADYIEAELTASNTFNIPLQQHTEDGITFMLSGNGILNGNQLNMTVVFNVQGNAITCVYNLTRQ